VSGPVNVVLLGPPGAGKGTQAEILAQRYGIPRVSTGDILRDAVQRDTPLGRAAQAVMAAGELVSDDIVIGIVQERLAAPDARAGFVLDGFPRTRRQADALDTLVAGRGPLVVIDIVVPEDVLVRRLLARRVCRRCGANAGPAERDQTTCARCGGPLVPRHDDSEAVVRERLKTYARATRPLVEFYRDRPTFRSVDGNQPPAVVAAAIEAAVASAVAAGCRA
jgi:adenylate kinase